MTPTDPKKPAGDDRPDRRDPRPGGHGSYKLGGEPATGHSWHEAPPPPPAPSGRYVADRCPRSSTTACRTGIMSRARRSLHNVDVEHEHSDINVRA